MAVTDLTTPSYPSRVGIVAARLAVWDPCTRKAKLGAKKGYVTQAVTDAQFTPDVTDPKKVEVESANPLRAYNNKILYPPLVKGGTLELTMNPGAHDAAAMWMPGANILESSTVIGWVDYVGAVAEQLCVEVWSLLDWGPECSANAYQVERTIYIGGFPSMGADSFTKGDDSMSSTLTLELQPLPPAPDIVLTGTVTVSGDATLTVSSTTGISVGDLITGTGVPAATRVLSITDATHLEMTANASASGTVSVTFSYGGPFGDFPAGVMTQFQAAYTASKSIFRARFQEADLPSTLVGAGFLTIT